MDIRIGNDIRIDITLSDYVKSDAFYINRMCAVLVHTCNEGCTEGCTHQQFCHHSEYTTHECGYPVYNVNPINAKAPDGIVTPWLFGFEELSRKEYKIDKRLIEDITHSYCIFPHTCFNCCSNQVKLNIPNKPDYILGLYNLYVFVSVYDQSYEPGHFRTIVMDFGTVFNLIQKTDDSKTEIVLNITAKLFDETELVAQRGRDGKDGESAYNVVVLTDIGNIFINGRDTCTLKAEVWYGSENITNKITNYYFSWTRTTSDADSDTLWNYNHRHVGPSVNVDAKDVITRRAMFQCNFDLNSYLNKSK